MPHRMRIVMTSPPPPAGPAGAARGPAPLFLRAAYVP